VVEIFFFLSLQLTFCVINNIKKSFHIFVIDTYVNIFIR